MNKQRIINFLSENPGSTAAECAAPIAIMKELEASGAIIAVGSRKTGKRGRPPIEWAVPGYDATQDPRVAEAVKEAQDRIDAHRRWERLSSVVTHMGNLYGYESDERKHAVAARKQAFPEGCPGLPKATDWAKVGIVVEVPEGLEEAVAA